MHIGSDSSKRNILTALADPDMVKILDACMYKPRSVNDIIKECNIPHTTAYRKIKTLLDYNLLTVIKIAITEDGKKYSIFKSVLKSINVQYDGGEIVIEVEQNVDPLASIVERFFSLDESNL